MGMKSLGHVSLGMTFVNSFNLLMNTDQYARSVTTGNPDTTYIVLMVLLIVVLGAIYYFVTSRAGNI